MSDATRRILFTADARFAAKPAADGKPATLVGYPMVWGAVSTDRGGYRVRLLKGSPRFVEVTRALFHHDFRDLLADTFSNTLRLPPADDYGQPVEIELPDT